MMSKCGSCGTFTWEISEEEPRHARFKMYFIRCAMCKVPIGVADYTHVPSDIAKVEKSLTTLGNSVTQMLQVIDENVRRLFQKR